METETKNATNQIEQERFKIDTARRNTNGKVKIN
jgi:hypothetical protein